MNEAAERRLTFAREDLRVAEVVLAEGVYNQVCFHAQQCVEKALKAMLVGLGLAPPRLHSITDLLSLFPPDYLAELRDDLVELDNYYIPTRCPDALPGSLPEGLPGESEAEEALRLAQILLARMDADA